MNLHHQMSYPPDATTWPAIVHMLNEFLLDARYEIACLRREIAQRDRAIEIYRQLIDVGDKP